MALVLTEPDVRAAVSMPELIAAMREALSRFSAGQVQQPLRTVLEIGEEKSFFGVMPAAIPEPAAAGTKLVTVFPGNREIGLPSHLATILLLDPVTGALRAVLDGRYITEARTAAVSAVSADVLARKDARTLGILGSGVQARSHLEALRCVRPFERVEVWSPTESRRKAFVEEMQQHWNVVAEANSPRQAVQEADVIVTATASHTPVLFDEWVGEGAHICAVGACRPTHRELDGRLVAKCRVFVDSRAGAFAEAGDILMAMAEGLVTRAHVAGELGEVLNSGTIGRQDDRQVTLFESLGMAIEDVVAAHLIWSRARARGLGSELAL